MKTTLKRLRAMLEQYPRVAITGGVKTGKTTLVEALELGREVLHTDDLAPLGWSEASAKAAEIVNAHQGPIIVEGVAVPRALRKGMKVDCVIWLGKAHVPLLAGQAAMTKGCQTVMREVQAADPKLLVLPWELDEQ